MNAVSTGIYNQLIGGTALTALLGSGTASVFEDHAPEDAGMPYVVFNQQSRVDDFAMGAASTDRYHDLVYQVKAVTDEAYPKTAATIDAQIDSRLHNASITATGYGVLAVTRESDVQYSEETEGQIFQHHGALYRVLLQKV